MNWPMRALLFLVLAAGCGSTQQSTNITFSTPWPELEFQATDGEICDEHGISFEVEAGGSLAIITVSDEQVSCWLDGYRIQWPSGYCDLLSIEPGRVELDCSRDGFSVSGIIVSTCLD